MRVISQDGFYDFPYDLVCLTLDENDRKTIYAIPNPTMESLVNYDTGFPVMGEYSTAEKARQAMKMLLTEYTNFQTSTDYRNYYFAFNYPKFFQFPADEDVEV